MFIFFTEMLPESLPVFSLSHTSVNVISWFTQSLEGGGAESVEFLLGRKAEYCFA
jgi:hypothetical protein